MVRSQQGAAEHGATIPAEEKPDEAPRERRSKARPRILSSVPLALVALALLGSVAIPARQTLRITRLLRETIQGLAPARLLVEQLQSGLAKELVLLQSYAISGDYGLLGEYRATAATDERRVVALHELADRSRAFSPDAARALELHVSEWHRFTNALVADSDSVTRSTFAAALERGEQRYDSSMSVIATLATDLAARSSARDARVDSLEHLSIASNAGLVLAAMVAMSGVLILTLRERELTAGLQRALRGARWRARREAALREAAEALAGAYSIDEVTRRIAHAALEAMRGRGAFVTQISGHADEQSEVVVKAVMGEGVLPVDARRAFTGSYTELVTRSGGPLLVDDLVALEPGGSFGGVPYPGGSAIVLPLSDGGRPLGALFVLGAAGRPFHPRSEARAEVFAHLATLAYEKVRLLEEAHEGRRALESVIQSRSRLMRGFSHDVKNPIGAADGFAELLTMGVYGDLTPPQQASVERMRRSIKTALSLIDDLHELARAETGMVTLTSEPVDLAELARGLAEEYHAAAAASGLAISVEAESDDAVVETDRARVRQIAANLLSNAIKYTDRGSVELRVRCQSAASIGDGHGWAVLEIADSGIGIAADKQEYIFEEFSRLNGGDRPGAGLGLAVSTLLAQALGGRISVQSEVGVGSTFALWLPFISARP